jgi:hypothetical protein
MNLVKYSKIINKHHERELKETILKMAKISERILVHRSYLSHQQMAKYKEKQIRIGQNVYFCLHYTELPRRARMAWNHEKVMIDKNA